MRVVDSEYRELELPERYELVSQPLLGQGGMGRVLQARDRVLDLPVAIKVVRPELGADPRFRKLFDLEVRVSARFTHPNIVPLHDHGELADGTPFLGLALADAGSFKTLQAEEPDWPEILRLTLELLDALSHLHARGVLHRDLKPENILLHTDEEGQRHVWLADLGLANAAIALAKRKGRREGTPGFMAPEQAMGLPREYGPWTDLYAVGAVLWQLVTGALPLEPHLTSANADLPTLEPRPGLLVPRDLSLVLKNCLDAEPLSRYDLAADLRTDLLALGPADSGRGDFDGPEERAGTIAKDAGRPGARVKTTSQLLLSMGEQPDTSPGLDPYVPFWNRPLPEALPEDAPEQIGAGGSARGSLQLFALRQLPLVAREAPRQALWEAARQVRDDFTSRVVIVVGAAGTGKTHLCRSVIQSLEEGGWAEAVTLTHQDPRGADDGYPGAAREILRPWKESRASLTSRLRRRLARERGVLDAALKEEVNLLTRWCGVTEGEDDVEEAVPQGLGLREVYRHLEARNWRGLSVMLIEDAHWGLEDGDGLWLAESMLKGAGIPGTLCIVTLRSEELRRNAALADRIQLMLEDGATRLDLEPLDIEDTRTLLGECLPLESSLAELVARRCEGNPLFAKQLLLEWARRDWLVREGRDFVLRDGVDTSEVLPTDAGALLQNRVEGLAEASGSYRRFRDTVHMAAMAGLDLPRDLLLSLAGEELEEFVLGCGLWSEGEDRLRFGSNLLHQAVRDQAEERRDAQYLHRRLGRAWARLGESGSDVAHLDVGRHAMAGRDFNLAIDHLMTACDLAFRKRDTNELVEASTLAVEATYRAPKIADRTGWAALWRGRGLQLRGEAESSVEHLERAEQHLKGLGDLKGTALAQIGLARAHLEMGKLEDCDAMYVKALETAREAGDVRVEVEVVQGRAWLEQQKRNFDGAEILFARASNTWRKLSDERGIGESLRGSAFVCVRRGEFDDADELYDEAIEAFQKGDDLLGTAWCLIGKGIVLRQRSRFDEAWEEFKRALSIGEELGATDIVMEARYRQAEVFRRQGDMEAATRLYTDHARWAHMHKKREAAIFAELGLAMVALQRNDLDELYHRTNAVSVHLAEMPAHWLWATYRLVVAAMLAHRDDEDQTYAWIWSASELGIADVVDEDIAYLLVDITAIAVRNDWRNVVRVAGKLAHTQLERLGDPDGAKFVKDQMDSVLLSR